MTTEEFFQELDRVWSAPSVRAARVLLEGYEQRARVDPNEPWIHKLVGHTVAELDFRAATEPPFTPRL